MDKIALWYLTDNEAGIKTADALKGMSLSVNVIESNNFIGADINPNLINIFIFDLEKVESRDIIKFCTDDQRLRGMVKFMIANKKEIKAALSEPFNLYRLEFIKRPVDITEFSLLIEKTVLVECYRDIVKTISKEDDNRMSSFEGLLSISRKDIFESKNVKGKFDDIVNYQFNSAEENSRLRKSISDFLHMCGGNVFDSSTHINGTQILSGLREKDLEELKGIFHKRKNVIDYSQREPQQMSEFYDISDIDNMETGILRDALKKERSLSTMLAQEIEFLLKELNSI